MAKKQPEQKSNEEIHEMELKYNLLRSKSVKELIAPSGIDASNINHLSIASSVSRYARSFYVANLPRIASFPYLFRDMYEFGDINVSVYINPIAESMSQNELNRTINTLETERIVASDRGNINRESILSQKKYETEKLRDEIASGFNKLYEASIISTLFSYSLKDLDKLTKILTSEMSKSLINIKSAWGLQEEAFQSNLPLMNDKIKKMHTFDRASMATVFPFTMSEVGHPNGVPIGYNKQTGTPILFDNFSDSLTNYNMVVFAKSGARKISYDENTNGKVTRTKWN